MKDLYEAALKISDELHKLEENGGSIPYELDKAWEDLTAALEANKVAYTRASRDLNTIRGGMKL